MFIYRSNGKFASKTSVKVTGFLDGSMNKTAP